MRNRQIDQVVVVVADGSIDLIENSSHRSTVGRKVRSDDEDENDLSSTDRMKGKNRSFLVMRNVYSNQSDTRSSFNTDSRRQMSH